MSKDQRSGRKPCVRIEMIEQLEDRRLLSFTPFPFPAGSASNDFFPIPPTMTAGPDGNLWVADANGDRLLRVKPDGSIAQFPLAKTADAIGITNGSDGNIWYIDDSLNTLNRVTPAGKITPFAVPKIGKLNISPEVITSGPDGNLWYIAYDDQTEADYIGRATPSGQITQWKLKTEAFLNNIIDGPDGNIWFGGETTLGQITPAGVTTLFNFADGISSLVSGKDGNLWISTPGDPFPIGNKPPASSQIERVSTAGKVTAKFSSGAPQGDDFTSETISNLTVGPDGNFWFSSYGSIDQMGRMTPAGVFTEFAIPGGAPYAFGNFNSTNVAGLASAPDGNLWYVPDSADQIVRFNFHNSILASNEYVDTTAGSTASSTIATFIDTGPALPASAYSATVDFGDGASAKANVAADGHGGLKVTLNYAWPIGNLSPTVTITQGSRSATASDYVTAVPPTPKGTGMHFNSIAGTQFSGNVADFTNIVLGSLDQYQFVGIDWGDGQFTDGALVPDGKGGAFVQGSHGYAISGHFDVQVFIIPPDVFPRLFPTPGSSGPSPFSGFGFASSHATITAGVMNGYGSTLLTESHHPVTQTYASFQFTDKSADLSHYHATLEWGDIYTDPQHPSVPMTIQPRNNGAFTVTLPVAFQAQGIAFYRIVITDDRLSGDAADVGLAYGQIIVNYPASPPPPDEFGERLVNLSTARVVGASGGQPDPNSGLVDFYNRTLTENVKATDKTLYGTSGQSFTGVVGDLGGVISDGTRLSDLHGTIDWGDGNSSIAAYTIDSKGVIHIQGTHTYKKPGKYTITVRTSQLIVQDGVPEYGMPDIRLPTVVSTIHVG